MTTANPSLNTIFTELSKPFAATAIKWGVGSKKPDNKLAAALPSISARAIADRLDTVMGPANWSDSYTVVDVAGKPGIICTLSLKLDGEWVSKSDGVSVPDFEPLKMGIDDALTRTAIKVGIGKYLFGLDRIWAPLKDGKYFATTPVLPDSALPAGDASAQASGALDTEAVAEIDAAGINATLDSPPAGITDAERVRVERTLVKMAAEKIPKERAKTNLKENVGAVAASWGCALIDLAKDPLAEAQD